MPDLHLIEEGKDMIGCQMWMLWIIHILDRTGLDRTQTTLL